MHSQAGQIVFEFILLLVVSVGIATFLTKKLINRSPDNPGIVTGAWYKMTQAIGQDIIE